MLRETMPMSPETMSMLPEAYRRRKGKMEIVDWRAVLMLWRHY
jgi:hypothetical protein